MNDENGSSDTFQRSHYREKGIQNRADSPYTEGELRAAKEYAEMIVDSVRESLLILDLDLRVQAANQSFYETFQSEPEETVGRSLFELSGGQWDIPELRELLEDILPENKAMDDYEVEHEFERIGHRVMLLNARQVDEHELILLAVEDVTERQKTRRQVKELNEALGEWIHQAREQEMRYQRLFESIDEGFCIVDVLFDNEDEPVDFRFVETNPAFVELTGLEGAEGRRMRELAPDHEEYWFETYGRVAKTGEPERFTNKAEQLGGRWYDVYAFRVGQPEERKVAILFNDITDRKRAQEALWQLNKTLEERVEERTRRVQELTSALSQAEEKERERISNILHDHLQQLLFGAAMSMRQVESLADRVTDPEIKEKQKRHLHQLEEILEEATRETKTLSVELSPPIATGKDLPAALEWLAGHMEERHGLAVEVDLAEDFQVAGKEMRTFLYQLTRELLFNVVKHAEVDQAYVIGELEDGQPMLRVQDEGKGFDKRAVEEKPTSKGLRNMKRRLEGLDGEMEIDSTPGEGTCVTVRLHLAGAS